MMTFWIIMAIMLMVALAMVIPVFLKKTIKGETVNHNSLNVAIYKEQQAELDKEDLTPAQRNQAQLELDKSLAQNLDTATKGNTQVRARWASLFVLIGIPIFALGMYWKLGAWHFIVADTSAKVTDASPHGEQDKGKMSSDFEQLIANLATRLENQPDDQQGWRMLARSYMVMERYPEAVAAYNKLLALVDDEEPQLLADLAQAMALSNEGQFAGQPSVLLKAALALDPNHQQTLWLLGLSSIEKQSYQVAIDYWEKLKQQLSDTKDAETLKMLNSHIANAYHQIGGESILANKKPSESTVVETQEQTTLPSGQIEVQVNLATELQSQVQANDTVFVYAKALKGSPMPLAIVKKLATELPMKVVLNDSMAMMPAMKLSNFKEVTIMARISRSGTATTEAGDLRGQISPVVLEKQTQVTVTIDQVVE